MTPPGLTPSITSPGYLGGSHWGSATFGPGSGTLVVNVSHVPNYTRIIPRAEADRAGLSAARPGAEGVFGYLAQEGLPLAAQTGPFLSPLGIPCTQPPYGEIAGIEMKTGRLAWKRRLGTAQGSDVGGITFGMPIEMGTPNVDGPIITAGA